MFSRRESGSKPRTEPPGQAEADTPRASEKATAATPNGDAPGLSRLDSAQGKKSVFDRLGQGASGSVVRSLLCFWFFGCLSRGRECAHAGCAVSGAGLARCVCADQVSKDLQPLHCGRARRVSLAMLLGQGC